MEGDFRKILNLHVQHELGRRQVHFEAVFVAHNVLGFDSSEFGELVFVFGFNPAGLGVGFGLKFALGAVFVRPAGIG